MNKNFEDDVLLAIPAYNEEKHIEQIIRESQKYMSSILVINDGSSDGTAEIVKAFKGVELIDRERNMGYGQTMMDAFGFAYKKDYKWLITMDCDFQHEPELLPKFLKTIASKKVDVVSGSRYVNVKQEEIRHVPAERFAINRIITRLINDHLELEVTDSFCGFKAYRVGAVAKLRLCEKGYAFPIEFWVQAARSRLRISELYVPAIYNDLDRSFGEGLDNPASRLGYYIEVFEREIGYGVYRTEGQANGSSQRQGIC